MVAVEINNHGSGCSGVDGSYGGKSHNMIMIMVMIGLRYLRTSHIKSLRYIFFCFVNLMEIL